MVGQSVFKVRAVYYEKAMLEMSSELQGLLAKTLALISCSGCHLRTVHRHKCLHKSCIQTFHGKICYLSIFAYLDLFELGKEISSLAALGIYTQAFKFTTTTTISSNKYIHYCLSVIIYSFP